MQIEELYFYHAYLNRLFFKGKLEAVLLFMGKEYNGLFDDPDTEVNIETEIDPFIICFNRETLEKAETEEDKVYISTVLLHEMIHQSNREKGIEDVERYTGEHYPVFKRQATHIGLKGGYIATDELKTEIKTMIQKYATGQKTILSIKKLGY